MKILNSIVCDKEGCDCRPIMQIKKLWLCEKHLKQWSDHVDSQIQKDQEEILDILE